MLHPMLLLREVGARIAKRFRTQNRSNIRPKTSPDALLDRSWPSTGLGSDLGAIFALSGLLFEPPRRPLGALGRLLGASWALLGRSGSVLGASWGASWGASSRSGAILGPPRAPGASREAFLIDFGWIWGRFSARFCDRICVPTCIRRGARLTKWCPTD